MPSAGPDAATVFAALGDPTRLALVRTLADGQVRSLSDLARGLPVTRQAVTKHLRVLDEAGLVSSRRAGRETRFAFRADRLGEMRAYLDAVEREWEGALGRLKDHLER